MLSKMRLWVREKGMPSYHSSTFGGVELYVHPIGWRRILRFLPYSQGERVRFRIGVRDNSKSSPLGRIAIYEDVLLPEGSRKERYPLCSDPYSAPEGRGSPRQLEIIGSVLLPTGLGRYTINHPLDKDAVEIVTFKTWEDAKLIMWGIGIVSPIVIGILMFFIGRWVN